jgi:phenylalanyl-tRNA synthetase beta chain
VYEKGVPPITTEQGFIRAVELFTTLLPGAKIISAIEDKGTNGKPASINITLEEIQQTLGIEMKEKEAVKILEDLEFIVKTKKAVGSGLRAAHSSKHIAQSTFEIIAPLHRLRDISGKHDVIEEVARIHGLDSIPAVMPYAPVQLPKRDQRIHTMRDALRSKGFWELTPLSLISPHLLKRAKMNTTEDTAPLALANPLGEETSLLQPSTLPQLLEHAQKHLPQSKGNLQTFQWGHVFRKNMPEELMLSALFTAKEETNLSNDPFLLLKQSIAHALKDAGYTMTVRALKQAPPFAHPGRTAEVMIDGNLIGWIYEVHPSVRTNFDLPHRAAACTISLTNLLKHLPAITKEHPLAQFPAITYDETIKRTQKDTLAPLMEKMRKSSDLLTDVSVHDLYAGKPLTNGDYNLTLRFIYRAADRTLTEDEAKKEHAKVMAAI